MSNWKYNAETQEAIFTKDQLELKLENITFAQSQEISDFLQAMEQFMNDFYRERVSKALYVLAEQAERGKL